eukprot:928367_1
MKVFELNKKHLKDLEAYHETIDGKNTSPIPRQTSEMTTTSIFPEWMSAIQMWSIMVVVLGSTLAILFWNVFPFLKERNVLPAQGCRVIPRATGFRTCCILMHSFINASVLLVPFFIWYFKNNCKISGHSQKDLPYSQRSLYYSYSINEGAGQQVAALGIATSNIMYALIIVFRFEYFKWLPTVSRTVRIDPAAAIGCLLVGLMVRVFASLVPSLPVHVHKKMHYLSAGLLFLCAGIYMLIETVCVGTSYEDDVRGDEIEMLFRRITCCMYWLAFLCTGVFMKLELWAFSSVGELVALLCSELYILTYMSSFRDLDADVPYLNFEFIKA